VDEISVITLRSIFNPYQRYISIVTGTMPKLRRDSAFKSLGEKILGINWTSGNI
jgi:hypothetical protein